MTTPWPEVDEVIAGTRQYAVVCGDSTQILPAMPERAVDHVITDPPYAEKTHAGARSRVNTGRSAYAVYGGSEPSITFAPMSLEEFLAFCADAVRVARRWVVMTCEWRYALAIEDAGLPLVRLGVWTKPDAAPQFSGDRPATGWEAVAILHRKGRKRWNGGGLPAVWRFGIHKMPEHPTQKPLPLLKEWVTQFTDPGDVILDPFSGSGTTLLAALSLGRRAIGIDNDPAHCATARRRLEEASGQTGLFAGLPPAAATPDLFRGLDKGGGGPPP